MFSGGALAAALASLAGAGAVGSAAVFAAVSVALIAFVRPIAKRHVYQAPLDRTGTAALIGTQALVLEAVDGNNGRIKLAGEIWSARLDLDVTSEPVPDGSDVVVTRIEGATALVYPVDPR